MKKFKFIRHDEKAMELPINIVVMLVVGMVALATLISIMPTPTKDMSVFVESAGLGGAASNTTDANGFTYLTTPQGAEVRLDPNQNEGTMDLKIVADGFYDYEKKDAVMIIKTR